MGWNISIIIIIFSLLHCPKQKGQGGGSTVWDIAKHKWVVNYRVLDQSFSLNLGSNGYNIFMISLLSIYILNLNTNIAPMFCFVSLAVCPFLFFFHCSWIISVSLFFLIIIWQEGNQVDTCHKQWRGQQLNKVLYLSPVCNKLRGGGSCGAWAFFPLLWVFSWFAPLLGSVLLITMALTTFPKFDRESFISEVYRAPLDTSQESEEYIAWREVELTLLFPFV